jgi:uncharacterized protein (DUF1697 family)
MGELRDMLEEAGYEDVRTLLQSGNVVVETTKGTDAVARDVEQRIAQRFGMDVDVVARTPSELEDVVGGAPLAGRATDPKRHFVVFLSKTPSAAALETLEREDFSPDEFAARGREVFAWCPEGMRNSRLMRELGGSKLAPVTTTRNFATVTKLLEMVR